MNFLFSCVCFLSVSANKASWDDVKPGTKAYNKQGFHLTAAFARQSLSYSQLLALELVLYVWSKAVEGWVCARSVKVCSGTGWPRNHCLNSVLPFWSHPQDQSHFSQCLWQLHLNAYRGFGGKCLYWPMAHQELSLAHTLNNNALSCMSPAFCSGQFPNYDQAQCRL